MKRSLIDFRVWSLALASVALLLAGALLPPLLGPGPREAIMAGYGVLCHQLPGRSFALGGVPLALCHRCMGVAAGLVLGALALPLLARARPEERARRLLPASLVPLALDWGAGVLGLWANTPESRLLTGAVFGLAAGAVYAGALARRPRPAVGASLSCPSSGPA